MFKKALHRITVVWCLYGLGRIIMFLNPYVMWVFTKYLDPTYPEGDLELQIVGSVLMWMFVGAGLFSLFIISCGIHAFANWFFNTK